MNNICTNVIDNEIFICLNVRVLSIYESTKRDIIYEIIILKNNISHLVRIRYIIYFLASNSKFRSLTFIIYKFRYLL